MPMNNKAAVVDLQLHPLLQGLRGRPLHLLPKLSVSKETKSLHFTKKQMAPKHCELFMVRSCRIISSDHCRSLLTNAYFYILQRFT